MTPAELQLMKSRLPQGYRDDIRDLTKFSYSYIDMVLKGERYNQVIIDCALTLLEESELAKRNSKSKFYRLTGAKMEIKPSDPKQHE